jgi:hypothetical protein
MAGKQLDDLGDYSYARRIARENADKPFPERWRLIRASQEHKDRRLLARTRASWMAGMGFVALLLFLLAMLALGNSLDGDLAIGGRTLPDPLAVILIAGVAAAGGAIGWRIGTRRALRKLHR